MTNKNDHEAENTPGMRIIKICLAVYVSIMVGIWAVNFIGERMEEHNRISYLKEQPGYTAYHAYIALHEEYEVYYMLNPEKGEDVYTQIEAVMSKDFFEALRATDTYRQYGPHEALVYFMLPDGDIFYGFEWDRHCGRVNNDTAYLYRCSLYVVRVPITANSLARCEITKLRE